MRLLLDAHLSPAVARELGRRGIDTVAAVDWLGGSYRTAPDEQLLAATRADQRILVTFDLRTIPALLKEWAESGEHHAGVILVDQRTLRPSDIGGLVRALLTLVERSGGENWNDRVVFLRAVEDGTAATPTGRG